VPKKIRDDDEAPRRRGGGGAAAVEVKRGLAMRIFLYSPKDTIAGLFAFAACATVIVNALLLQHGQHPAPMFSSTVALALVQPANPLPRPRPVEADAVPSETRLAEPRQTEPHLIDPKAQDPLANLVKTTTSPPLSTTPIGPQPAVNVARPPASIPPAPLALSGTRRVAALQRALTEYGYGQLKPTGTIGPDTQAAIQKFERERRLPVTGQVSDRLMRELAAVIGHSIE
jgi:Putative peptidoglycan binding domain